MYRLFYNRENVGDVLFIVLDALAYPDASKTNGEVTALYKGDELIGINLFNFSKTVKIKAHGMIVTPEDVLIDVINSKLQNAGLPMLPYTRESGFVVAEVNNIEEHPLDERSNILTLKVGEKTLSTVTRYQNISIGSHIVVVCDGAIKFDGVLFQKKIVKNIPIECEVCCEADLRIGEEFKSAFLVDLPSGTDFFLN